ncbi:MAG: formiminoglutamate deiminase [Frankiales bacterium]|nr:formiminoglutamate deiminase [Frankiales bacterium]
MVGASGCPTMTSSWFADFAVTTQGLQSNVRIDIDAGRFVGVTAGGSAAGAARLPGVVLPGFANAHSHAFHRALRGRLTTAGDFWAWQQQMYRLADRVTPSSYLALARALYAEMALAGVTTVGEFHYLHHGPAGQRYADENELAYALIQAAHEAGIRLTLLDACYLAGGLDAGGHRPLAGVQLRFGDADADGWLDRVADLQASTPVAGNDSVVIGAAIHSVRAVPRQALATVAKFADGQPLHVHLSEQPAENAAALAFYGRTPTALLSEAGVLGPDTTAVHATHVSNEDIALLGQSHTSLCLCPSTERDLADGIGRAGALSAAGCRLSVGSDQHSQVDLIAEARDIEQHERLATGVRGTFGPDALLGALTQHASLGVVDASRIEVGRRADLVAIRLDSPRTAGIDPALVINTASSADVDTVLVDGDIVVANGQHRLGDVGALLARAVEALWEDA